MEAQRRVHSGGRGTGELETVFEGRMSAVIKRQEEVTHPMGVWFPATQAQADKSSLAGVSVPDTCSGCSVQCSSQSQIAAVLSWA